MSRDCYEFSDGHVVWSMLDALVYLKTHPDVTVKDVDGVDVTVRFRGILANHGYGSGS